MVGVINHEQELRARLDALTSQLNALAAQGAVPAELRPLLRSMQCCERWLVLVCGRLRHERPASPPTIRRKSGPKRRLRQALAGQVRAVGSSVPALAGA